MKDFHFKTEISLFAGNVYRNVIMPVFPFSQMKPKHFSQLICPIYFRNPIRLYESHLLIYRQRMVHIPAGISDYCWSLPEDHGVPSEDASHILFLSFLCVAADLYPIDIVHQYLLHHRRSKQKDFLSPPGQSSRDIELALANAFKASSCCRHWQSWSASCLSSGG